MSIRLRDVDVAYDGASPILQSISIEFLSGWTGVVGENGAGKSSLLRVVAGSLAPLTGHRRITIEPAEIVVVEQRVEVPGVDTERFFDDWSTSALRWRSRLSLEDDQPARWSTLSAGERKRWQLAAALARRPDVLLVDEPTNHLDPDAVERVVDALRAFSGIGVVITHDRRVLELCGHVVEVRAKAVRELALGYEDARAEWTRMDEAARHAAESRRTVAKRRATRAMNARRRAAEADQHISARTRMKSAADSDARGVGARARAMKAAARLSARAASARTVAERAAENVPFVEKRRDAVVRFDRMSIRRSFVARFDGELVVDDAVLASDVKLVVGPQDRIAIVGRNGAGKSTLLAALVHSCPLTATERLVVEQDVTAHETHSVLDDLTAMNSDDRGAFLARCAALGIAADDLLGRHPSPGVVRKARIANALGRGVGAMFLDEPTNHLDLPSVERLEAALAAYEGALVVVSHDRRFLRALGVHVHRLEDGALSLLGPMG